MKRAIQFSLLCDTYNQQTFSTVQCASSEWDYTHWVIEERPQLIWFRLLLQRSWEAVMRENEWLDDSRVLSQRYDQKSWHQLVPATMFSSLLMIIGRIKRPIEASQFRVSKASECIISFGCNLAQIRDTSSNCNAVNKSMTWDKKYAF